ncbi:hypothetical protein P0Y35_04175 [Kiritimatiellaeota bacterium B1221]|nr:hypothetical protein [Kiritimatiellaeota bacterium B1221]
MSALWAHIHFFCAAYMCGIIWFVQRVHYPMLHLSNGEESEAGHKEYTQRMGTVVMPVMLAELALQTLWVIREPGLLSFIGGALLFTIWLSTFALQVPCHQKLQQTFEPAIQQRLVHTNWIRTLGWTTRVLLVGWAFQL